MTIGEVEPYPSFLAQVRFGGQAFCSYAEGSEVMPLRWGPRQWGQSAELAESAGMIIAAIRSRFKIVGLNRFENTVPVISWLTQSDGKEKYLQAHFSGRTAAFASIKEHSMVRRGRRTSA